ncbi:MAG: insulinase family protein [Thermodesulfovibrionales bacterium]|nr:insulinase family protein [Thermodesulfovibrionales bacterium]
MIKVSKNILILVSIVLLVFIYTYSFAETTEHFLKNTMKVLLIKDSQSPFASFQIWYKVGSKDEPVGKTGISHLLEHMMFKGTEKYGSKEFSNMIQRHGGTDNAFTTKDYTMYFQNISAKNLDIPINLESDRMTNLKLDEKEVISEREVVKEERRLRYEDDPQNKLYEDTIALSLMVSNYRNPIIGWMNDIASIQREDLYEHYKNYYSPENAFIIVAGDIDKDAILKRLDDTFGKIKKDANIKRIKTKEPEQNGERRIILKKEAELPYIFITYHAPNFPHKDSYALEVLSSILSSGKSSRLYKSLVYEKKVALNVFASYSGFYQNPFLFILGGTPNMSFSANDLEKAILDEIRQIKDTLVSENELEKAKNQIESSFILAQDSAHMKALYTGIFEILGDWRMKDRYLEGIRAVKIEDIRYVAKKYLDDDKKTVGILIPTKRDKGDRKE